MQEDRSGSRRSRDSSTNSALFDLELSIKAKEGSIKDDSQHTKKKCDVKEGTQPNTVLHNIAYLAQPMAIFEREILQDVKALRKQCLHSDGQLSLRQLGEGLQKKGYRVKIIKAGPRGTSSSPAQSGSAATAGTNTARQDPASILEKIKHKYLVCTGYRDASSASVAEDDIVIDPRFQEQFVISPMSRDYQRVLPVIPAEFVGTRLRLEALVGILADEIGKSFAELNLPLPPWRRKNAFLSRWERKPANTLTQQPTATLSARSSMERQNSGGSDGFYQILDLHMQSLQLAGKQLAGPSPRKCDGGGARTAHVGSPSSVGGSGGAQESWDNLSVILESSSQGTVKEGSCSDTSNSKHGSTNSKCSNSMEKAAMSPSVKPVKKNENVVSLLAKGLKSISQKDSWHNLLPTVKTVKRTGNVSPFNNDWTLKYSSTQDGSASQNRFGGIPKPPSSRRS